MTKVDGETKLSTALALHEDVLPYVIDLDPHTFRKLEQPLVRRAMATRLTLARVARMTGVPLGTLIVDICSIAGIELSEADRERLGVKGRSVSARAGANGNGARPDLFGKPEWAEDLVEEDMHVLDLTTHEHDADGRLEEAARATLRLTAPGDVMLVKSSREPRTLYALWDERGDEHFAEQVGPGEWWIFVRRSLEE